MNGKKGVRARGPLALALKTNAGIPGSAELNAVDTTISNMFVSSAITVQLLNGTAPGTNFYQRVGRISMKSVRIKLSSSLRANAATAVNNQNARVWLIYDRSPTEHSPALPTFLQMSTKVALLY